MKVMDSYDIPVLRAKGFSSLPSGHSWFRVSREGHHWQVYVEDNTDKLRFSQRGGASMYMSRIKFDEVFK